MGWPEAILISVVVICSTIALVVMIRTPRGPDPITEIIKALYTPTFQYEERVEPLPDKPPGGA